MTLVSEKQNLSRRQASTTKQSYCVQTTFAYQHYILSYVLSIHLYAITYLFCLQLSKYIFFK